MPPGDLGGADSGGALGSQHARLQHEPARLAHHLLSAFARRAGVGLAADRQGAVLRGATNSCDSVPDTYAPTADPLHVLLQHARTRQHTHTHTHAHAHTHTHACAHAHEPKRHTEQVKMAASPPRLGARGGPRRPPTADRAGADFIGNYYLHKKLLSTKELIHNSGPACWCGRASKQPTAARGHPLP